MNLKSRANLQHRCDPRPASAWVLSRVAPPTAQVTRGDNESLEVVYAAQAWRHMARVGRVAPASDHANLRVLVRFYYKLGVAPFHLVNDRA
jgi:hypothetical protein